MKKRFKIAFWTIGLGWFPMVFVTASSVNWNREYGFWLLMVTFFICIIGCFILLTTPIDHIFKSTETLNKEIARARELSIESRRWIEATKRMAVIKAGLKKEDLTKMYDSLVERNWQPK